MNDKEKMELLNPAFPTETSNGYWHGMSLRDYFAAKALCSPTCLALSEQQEWSNKKRAEWAFQQADAMLAAREHGELQAE